MGQTKRGSSNWTSHRLVPDFIFLFYKHCCSITKWRLSSRVCKCAARCRGLWQCGSSPAIFTPLILQFPPSATITKQHSVPPKSNTCNILLSAVSSAPYLSNFPIYQLFSAIILHDRPLTLLSIQSPRIWQGRKQQRNEPSQKPSTIFDPSAPVQHVEFPFHLKQLGRRKPSK